MKCIYLTPAISYNSNVCLCGVVLQLSIIYHFVLEYLNAIRIRKSERNLLLEKWFNIFIMIFWHDGNVKLANNFHYKKLERKEFFFGINRLHDDVLDNRNFTLNSHLVFKNITFRTILFIIMERHMHITNILIVKKCMQKTFSAAFLTNFLIS